MGKIKSAITNALGLGGGLAVGQKLLDMVVDKGVEKGTEVVGERLKPDEEWRDEMYSHWLYMRDTSSSEATREGAGGLIRQHGLRNNRDDDSETKIMHTLGYLWKHMEDAPRIRNHVFYKALGHMNDEEFETALSALRDDKVMQWFNKVLHIGKNAYKTSEEWAVGLFNRALDALVDGDHETTREKLKALFEEMASKLQAGDQLLAEQVNRGGGFLVDALKRHNEHLDERGWE